MITADEKEVIRINTHLANVYGRELNGLPRFRIVFSDDQFENGEPKYSYIRERWLLERYFIEDYTYCAIWTFSIQGEYVFPQQEWCDMLCFIAMNPPRIVKSELKKAEDEALMKDAKALKDMLDEDEGVHDMKNQKVNFVKPVFLNRDHEQNKSD